MRVEKNVCDRCGKEIVYKGWTSKLKLLRWHKLHLLRLLNGNPSGYDYSERGYELCADCTNDFEQFMKEPAPNGR